MRECHQPQFRIILPLVVFSILIFNSFAYACHLGGPGCDEPVDLVIGAPGEPSFGSLSAGFAEWETITIGDTLAGAFARRRNKGSN